jgi:hypothetical protein
MVHDGKTMDGNAEDGGVQRMSRGRIAAWVAAALLLLLPWVAGAPWSGGDFIFAGILLFGSLGAYEVAARMTGDTAYRAGIGVAIAAAFLLIWVNAAVGITDSDADGMYLAVVAVGIIGALIARFRPEGMARAMLATALAHASVGVIALIAGIIPPHNSAFEILGLTAFFVVLFGGSALLFREAARGGANDT